MELFLVSDLKYYSETENGVKSASAIDSSNDIVDVMTAAIGNKAKSGLDIACVSSDKDASIQNDDEAALLAKSLELSGIKVSNINVLDERNSDEASSMIPSSDVVFLSDGVPYQQKAFFDEIGLSELLANYDGIVVANGKSVINCAKRTFNSPENMGKSDPLVYDGISISAINVEPHFAYHAFSWNTQLADEEIYKRDAVLSESKRRALYGIPDGSFIVVNDSGVFGYGDICVIKNSNISAQHGTHDEPYRIR